MSRGEYGDVHRLVVQTFMSKKIMLEKDALELVKRSIRKYPGNQVAEPRNANELSAFLKAVDKEIGAAGVGYAEFKRLGFKASLAKEDPPEIYWGLQSLKDEIKEKGGELSKLMDIKQYSDSELCLLKMILEELCTIGGKGKNGMLDHNTAINLCAKVKPRALKVDDAMACIDRFVEEGWLTFKDDPNGRGGRHTSKRVSLGVRAMMDLKRFVLETWPADELCCVWEHDWQFKWIASSSAEVERAAETEEEEDVGEDEAEEQGRHQTEQGTDEAEGGGEGGSSSAPSKGKSKSEVVKRERRSSGAVADKDEARQRDVKRSRR